MELSENLLNFVVESEESNAAVLDFIRIKYWRADDVDL
jgi:hypothetical protein